MTSGHRSAFSITVPLWGESLVGIPCGFPSQTGRWCAAMLFSLLFVWWTFKKKWSYLWLETPSSDVTVMYDLSSKLSTMSASASCPDLRSSWKIIPWHLYKRKVVSGDLVTTIKWPWYTASSFYLHNYGLPFSTCQFYLGLCHRDDGWMEWWIIK